MAAGLQSELKYKRDMNNLDSHIISRNTTLKDALIMLNQLGRESLTLFVVDSNNTMIGTLTDGDIRRKLVEGISLSTPVEEVMNKSFKYIVERKKDVRLIHEFKQMVITLLPCLDDENKIVDLYDLKNNLSILPIDAVLMAGGKGERLRPLTQKIPKPLLPINNKAIIDHNIERLITCGIKHISVTVNYMKEEIEQHFSKEYNGIKIQCIPEPKFLGTIGSIKYVKTFYNDIVLVMNSDLFTNINYEEFYLHFIEEKADMAVAVTPYLVSIPYGVLELDKQYIKNIKEKPTYSYYINAGMYLVKKELLSLIPDNTYFNATDLMTLFIQQRLKIIRYPITGYWIDIGKMDDYEKAIDLAKHIK